MKRILKKITKCPYDEMIYKLGKRGTDRQREHSDYLTNIKRTKDILGYFQDIFEITIYKHAQKQTNSKHLENLQQDNSFTQTKFFYTNTIL